MNVDSGDMKEIVKKIKKDRFVGNVDFEYDVLCFSNKQLRQIRAYLDGKEKGNKLLIKCIDREIANREIQLQKEAQSHREPPKWFRDMWYAVLSLFDKGIYKNGDAYAEKILGTVKDEWKFNNYG